MSISRRRFTAFFTALLLAGINIACTKVSHTAMTATDTTNTTDTTQVTYLALGDSYTIGQSVEVNERFPAQAVAMLQKQGVRVAAPQYIATTGWTTVDLQNAIESQQPKGPFGLVTLLIGVNDQYRQYAINEYPDRFARLLQTAIALAGNRKERVIVLSIPDYSVTPYGGGSIKIHDEIDAYNAINNKITFEKGVTYLNITGISRIAATDPTLIADDGLHPSAKQYALWVDQLVPLMERALK